MKVNKVIGSTLIAAAALFSFSGSAIAVDIACENVSTTKNYMLVDDAYVSTCIDAGVGNLGNAGSDSNGVPNDAFIAANPSYAGTLVATDILTFTFTQNNTDPKTTTGNWSINSSYWSNYDALYLGFKFGTGNEPDEWFVYSLQSDVSEGAFTFVNVNGKGGGLSHMAVYGTGDGSGDTNETPEPGTVALVAIALLGFGAAQRRRKA